LKKRQPHKSYLEVARTRRLENLRYGKKANGCPFAF
jgi:hypothetical protein